MITTIAFLNNPISASLAHADFARRGIPLKNLALIMVRPWRPAWADQCAAAVIYTAKPSNQVWEQRRFIGFYREAAKLIRDAIQTGKLEHIYTVNNDNLIASHLLQVAPGATADVTVVVEGLMNFQDIDRGNRQGWRWRIKPILARLLGLSYRQPTTHLSGAFEPEVDRVISFAEAGLKAPPEKVECIPFPSAKPTAPANPKIALIPLTGLAQWMQPYRARQLAIAFREWLEAQNFDEIIVKHHPHSDAGVIEELLPAHRVLNDPRSLEDMAPDLTSGTIVGTCCTGLVTLKLMRPDLQCVDFGADFYQIHAYQGDTSVESLLRASGVNIVAMSAKNGD